MGLVPAFVFSLNRRAILAILAISISVGYTLVAGAAVSGLKDAQGALAGDLGDRDRIVAQEGLEGFTPEALGGSGSIRHGHAVTTVGDHTFYTVRIGAEAMTNGSRAIAGPASALTSGQQIPIEAGNLTVFRAEPPPGASPSWIQVTEGTFQALGGQEAPTLHVAVITDAAQVPADQGFVVQEAPSTFQFYEAGAQQIVSAVAVTVLASAVVIALLTSTFISMELRARRQSLATLQLYAGPGLVQRLVAGRAIFLLVAGHALAIGGTMGLLFLLERVGSITLAISTTYAGIALAATFGGGLVGMVPPVRQAASPLDVERLSDQAPRGWLPRWLRPSLTSWRTVIPLAASALILAGSLGVIFGTVDMPSQIFGTEGSQVLADTKNNPLRGQVDAFQGLHLASQEAYAAASPEIFAPTTIDGAPVMARGVSWPHLTDMDPVQITDGRAMEHPGEAVAGQRLAARLDLAVGDRLLLPASYSASLTPVTVVGIATAPGLLADELLVDLPTARDLTGLPASSVNLVRFREAETGPLEDPQRHETGIEVTNLRVDPRDPIPYEQARVLVDAVNIGDENATRHLTLRVNGQPVTDRWVRLVPQEETTVSFTFRVPAQGLTRVEINPEETFEPGDPAYRLDLPRAVERNSTVQITVRDRQGDTAPDVTVELDGRQARTDARGQASMVATELGNRTVTAEGPDGRGARWLQVVEPGLLHRGKMVVRDVNGPADAQENGTWQGAVVAENVGGSVFQGYLHVPVDGTAQNASAEVTVRPGQTTRALVTLDLSPGNHVIGTQAASLLVHVPDSADPGDGDGNGTGTGTQDGGAGDGSDPGSGDGQDTGTGDSGDDPAGEDGEPTLEELLERRRQQAKTGNQEEETDALTAFLGDTVDNLNAALTVVALATVLHAGLIVLVAVQRDVEEAASTVGTLAAVGADRQALRRQALREFGTIGAIAAAVGTALGLFLVWAAAQQGLLVGFGHALIPRSSVGFGLRVAAVAIVVTLAAAVLAVERVRRQRADQLLAEGPRRSARPPLEALIGRDEAP